MRKYFTRQTRSNGVSQVILRNTRRYYLVEFRCLEIDEGHGVSVEEGHVFLVDVKNVVGRLRERTMRRSVVTCRKH